MEAAASAPETWPLPRAFRFVLATGAAESFGDVLVRTALPVLAVSVLGLGADFVGVLNAAGLAAFLLLGMPIGMFIDRTRNRVGVMGAATLVRCLVALFLAAGYYFGLLSGAALLAAAVLAGVADVVFTASQGTVIPAAVPPQGLKAAFSRLALTNQATSTTAAGAGSAALALLGLPGLLLAAAVSYAGSLSFQRGIRTGPVTAVQRVKPVGRFRRGFAVLRRTPALWALTLSGSLINAGAMLGNTVLPVYILRDLGIPAAAYAALGVISAAGAMAGAAAAPQLTKRLGLKSLRTSAALLSFPLVLSAAACPWLPGPELLWLSAQSLGWGFLVSLSAVAGAEVLPRTVAREELATVGSAQRTVTLGIMPVAALLGGAAAAVVGAVPLLIVWALLAAAAALPLLRVEALNGFR